MIVTLVVALAVGAFTGSYDAAAQSTPTPTPEPVVAIGSSSGPPSSQVAIAISLTYNAAFHCVAGSNGGAACTDSSECPGSTCGPNIVTVAPLVFTFDPTVLTFGSCNRAAGTRARSGSISKKRIRAGVSKCFG